MHHRTLIARYHILLYTQLNVSQAPYYAASCAPETVCDCRNYLSDDEVKLFFRVSPAQSIAFH